MTHTVEYELSVCTDCIMIITNDDSSGIEDPEDHRARMAERWSGYYLGYGGNEDDVASHSTRSCDGCGDVCHGKRHAAHATKRES